MTSPDPTPVPAASGRPLPVLAPMLAMLEQWPGAALLLDQDFQLLWCSQAALQLASSASEDLAGLRYDALGMPWQLLPEHLSAALAGAAVELDFKIADQLAHRNTHHWRLRLRRIELAGGAAAVLTVGELQLISAQAGGAEENEQFFDAAQAGIWRWNVATDESSVDEAWCRQHKLDACSGPHQLVRWSSQMHPDDSPLYRRRLTELRTGGADYFEAEYRILTRENAWLWILQRGRVIGRDERGTPLRVNGICIEIDQRKREETASKANESRLATALWGARAAFWQWHVPTDVRTMSPMWYAMTRYTREQWDSIPNAWFSRLHSSDCEAVEAAVRAYRSGATEGLEYEYRMMTANGEWKWILDRARAVEWDLEGHPAVIMGVSLDIDTQKRAQEELKTTEARLQTAVWGARMGLWETDLLSDSTRWFDQWCQQYGIDPCDGPDHQRRWLSRVHPAEAEGVAQRYQANLDGKQDFYDSEYRIMTTAGVWRWIFCRARITERDESGRPLRLVGVCMDVDERRQEQMQQHFTQPWLESALSAARGGLWHWQIKPEEVTYTDTYYRLFGVDPQAGRREVNFWLDHIHEQDLDRVRAMADDVAAGRLQEYEAEYRMRCDDGRYIWVLDRARVQSRLADGRAESLVGFIIDVTQGRAEREALAISEERFRSAALAARGMIYEVHYPLSANGARISARFGLEAMLGYHDDEIPVTHEAWVALLHPDDVARFLAARSLDRTSGCAADLEYRVRHKHGHWVRLRDRGITLTGDDGRPSRRVGFLQSVEAQSDGLLEDATGLTGSEALSA